MQGSWLIMVSVVRTLNPFRPSNVAQLKPRAAGTKVAVARSIAVSDHYCWVQQCVGAQPALPCHDMLDTFTGQVIST
jgi:hypothetical protein